MMTDQGTISMQAPRVPVELHPCFNHAARLTHARAHLPVAPKCNMQCNYCNRKFDCMNESRPGVTCMVLSPCEALEFLKEIKDTTRNLSVVGIAGPGDPFANPDETIETLRLVREQYRDMMLCLATNGLNVLPYVPTLAKLDVSHVTITVNAVEPTIGAKIYSWISDSSGRLDGAEAAGLLWEQQERSIVALRSRGILVKINSILIPGVNDHHVTEIAEKVARLGANLFNLMPLYPVSGTPFAAIPEPGPGQLADLRSRAGQYLLQMTHCSRCRADAVGKLAESGCFTKLHRFKKSSHTARLRLQESESSQGTSVRADSPRSKGIPMKELHMADELICHDFNPARPYVAIASTEGAAIDLPLGKALSLYIYRAGTAEPELVERRPIPPPSKGLGRWMELGKIISDCGWLLAPSIGEAPFKILVNKGIMVYIVEGSIAEALQLIAAGRNLNAMARPEVLAMPAPRKESGSRCTSSGCGGGGRGCYES